MGAGRPVRILINGIHAKSGGGVTYLRDILPEFAARNGAEIHLFLHESQFAFFHPLPETIRVSLFNFKPTLVRTLIWEQFSIPVLAWAMGADVVFSPANYGPLFARNHVIMLRNAVAVFQIARSWNQKLYWLAITIATFLSLATCRRAIAVSGYARKSLTFGFKRLLGRKVRIVHHGSRFAEIVRNVQQRQSAFLLAVSDIYVQKNYHSLIDAFAVLARKHPDIELRIAGRELDTEYAESLKAQVRRLALQDKVSFLGHVSVRDLETLYSTCSVFVFPSTVETFGNPLVEAMACGAAIAGSDVTSIPEVLGDAGLLFDPRDPADMAEKIELLMEDGTLRSEKRARAKKRARGFSWPATAEQTFAVLSEAIGPLSSQPRRPR